MSLICGFRMERGKVRPDTATRQGSDREPPSSRTCKGLSTVAGRAGGPARSSGEAPAMGVERRGRVICGCVRSVNRVTAREELRGRAESSRQAV